MGLEKNDGFKREGRFKEKDGFKREGWFKREGRVQWNRTGL